MENPEDKPLSANESDAAGSSMEVSTQPGGDTAHDLLEEPDIAEPANEQEVENAGNEQDMEQAYDQNSDPISAALAEKANFERVNFNLNVELADTKEKIVVLSQKNNELQEQIKIHVKELGERSRLFTQVESARNNIAMRNIALESEIGKLKQEKEARDADIRELTREKNLASTEYLKCKEELKDLSGVNSKLQLQVNGLEQDGRNLSLEKEWRTTDKQFYEESKKWFVEELGKKDAKITELNMEIAAKQTQYQNHNIDLTRDISALQAKLKDMEEKLALKQESVDRVTASIERQAETSRKELRNLELSLKTQEDLAKLYKEQLERAEECSAKLEEQSRSRQDLVDQTRNVLEEVRKEREDEKNIFLDQLAEKESELRLLREEVEKMNDLLKNKHAVSLNVTEEELANMCPAAAETSRFLKGGATLTGLVRDYSILAGDLASEKQKNAELEKTIRQIVEEIEQKAPMLLSQKDQLDKLFDENSRLKEQLQTADVNRVQVESNRDQAMRELAFTRAELEKYQRDYASLAKKHQHIIYVLEKQQQNERDTDSPPMTEEDNSQLYDSIGQLQKRNMQLESALATERSSASQVMVAAHNQELEVLRRELVDSHDNEKQLSVQLEQLTNAFSKMKEQSEKLRELVEDDVNSEQARMAKLKAEEYLAELSAAKITIARLEGSLATVREEKKANESVYEQRILNNQALINELQATRSKLEAKFEQQKQVATETYKEYEIAAREKERVEKENADLRNADGENGRRVADMHQEVLRMHTEASDIKIKHRVAAEELERANSEISGLKAQLDVYKNQRVSDQHVMGSITELSNRLNRVQAERDSRFATQLEVLQVERDQLKTDMCRTNEVLSQVRHEARDVKMRLEQEIKLLKQNLSEKDEQLQVSEVTLMELRNRLSALQSELITDGNSEEMSPERLRKECQQLKNRVQFLESQCEEKKVELDAVKAEISRRDTVAQKMEAHSDKMEEGLKANQQMATMERELLEARASVAEKRCNDLSEQVAQLQTLIDEKHTEIERMNLTAVHVQGDLQIKIDVKEQQLLDQQNRLAILDERVHALEAENINNQSILETLRHDVSQADARMEDSRLQLDVLTNKLRTKENECMIAEDNARMAEESRIAAVQALEVRTQQSTEAEAKWQAAVKDHDERLKQLMAKYDEVIAQLGSSNDSMLGAQPLDPIVNPEVPSAVIQSMQTVMDFLRKEKDDAMERAMNAEVEARRLRADHNENQTSRNELVVKVRNLETAAAVAEQMTAERAELLKKLETMTVTQQQYQRLTAEKDNLMKLTSEAQKQVRERDQLLNSQRNQMSEINTKLVASQSEMEKNNKEIEALKQTLQQQQSRLQQKASDAKTEQLQTQYNQKLVEVEQLTKQLQSMDKQHTDLKNRFEQTRQLAVKFRSEVNQLKSRLAAAQGGSAAASGSSSDVSDNDSKATIDKLQQEKKDLEIKLSSKSNELEEVGFRLNLIQSKLTNLEKQKKELEDDNSSKQNMIETLQRQNHSQDLPSNAELAVSAPVSAAVPPSVPSLAIHDEAPTEISAKPVSNEAVEALKSSDVVSPPDAGLSVDVDVSESSTASFAPTTSKATPHIKSFTTRSSTNVTSASSTTIPTFCGAKKVEPSIAQSNLVSGSLANADEASEENQNDSAGESRDSMTNAPVSSTEGSRKRPAGGQIQVEAKRQRESSNEAVTSSEERAEIVIEDDGAFIPDPVHADQQNEDDDDDIIPLDPPNHGSDYFEGNENAYDEEDDEDEEEELEVPDSEEGEGESDMDEEEEDEDEEESENSGDEEGDDVQPPRYGEIEILDSDSDNQEDDDGGDAGQDEEVLGADENSRSQPILDDQDREAASAVEEADDEGRASADGGIHDDAAQPAPSVPRIRVPIKFDREDQCSSSNESGSAAQSSRPPQMARRGAALRPRGGRSIQQLYHPGRGLRGRGNKK